MKELILRHYEATRQRGLINSDTEFEEFQDKIDEEILEMDGAYNSGEFQKAIEESIDVAAVILNMLTHYGFDFEELYRKNVEHQESRI